jgi:DNA-binding transcriptional LysR family regulator
MFSTVELREIRTFLTLAEELHFGRAAERLDVTTSRVSQTIRLLETRAGGRLFDRTSRRVMLTALGEQLQCQARPAYEQLERAFVAIREVATGITGPLRIGMYTPINGGPHLLEIVRSFEADHPACPVQIIDIGLERQVMSWLYAGDLELLAIRLPVNDPALTIGPTLACEERVLAVAREHPLAAFETVSWEDVAEYPVTDPSAAIPSELADDLVPPVTSSGRSLRRIRQPNFGQVVLEVARGKLVHPTVRSFLDHHRHPGITAVPIRDLPPSQTALVWLTSNRSANIDAFAHTATNVLHGHRQVHTEPPAH